MPPELWIKKYVVLRIDTIDFMLHLCDAINQISFLKKNEKLWLLIQIRAFLFFLDFFKIFDIDYQLIIVKKHQYT